MLAVMEASKMTAALRFFFVARAVATSVNFFPQGGAVKEVGRLMVSLMLANPSLGGGGNPALAGRGT